MYARVSRYEFPPERIDDVVPAFRDALERIRGTGGLRDAYVLVEREARSQVLTITLWDSEAAMAAGRMAAIRARSEAANAAGGTVESSSEYEIALHERAG